MISFRRTYLDEQLTQFPFAGTVLDLGGEKKFARGKFRPPVNVERWIYANMDPKTEPDLVCEATCVPLESAQVDYVLFSEVLEHLREPEKALREVHRLLRPGGTLVLTVPFLFSVHGDPFDFQRWTPEKLRMELAAAGFTVSRVDAMGGILGVSADLFEMHCHLRFQSEGRLRILEKIFRTLMRRVLLRWLLRLDRAYPYRHVTTTGYFVVATRAREVTTQ